MIIKPQEGPQENYLACGADIAIFGGAAGGGKTYATLIDPLRFIDVPGFGATIFRRTSPEITTEGSLWDEACRLYPLLGGIGRQSPRHEFKFPGNTKISFAHLQHEKNVYGYQSSQIPLIVFEEVCHFTEFQFWYMLSRNRSVCGVRPYMRATCNPDPDSFVAKLIAWWIDQDTGYAIPERSGVIRWFTRVDNEMVWGHSYEDVRSQVPNIKEEDLGIKSFTFIESKLTDNKILMQQDPGYMASLNALPLVEREQLKHGNWRIRPAPGLYFKRHYFEVVDSLPVIRKSARGWDLAGTDKSEGTNPDYTASVRMDVGVDGYVYITDLTHDQLSPAKVKNLVRACASQDGRGCTTRMAQDPAQAGKDQIQEYRKLLMGYTFRDRPATGDKVTRAGAFSSASEHGLVKVLRAPWNDKLFNHLEAFPPKKGSPDIVDAAVEAYGEVTQQKGFFAA